MNKIIIIFFCGFLFTSCSSIDEDIFDGKWIINEYKFNGKPVMFNTLTKKLEVEFSVAGYEDKFTVIFAKEDSSCLWPGINTERVALKWKIENDSLVIWNNVNQKSLNEKKLNVINTYTGTYSIKTNKYNNYRLILTSKTHEIELINFDKALDKRIKDII